jgi:hypothetical protein
MLQHMVDTPIGEPSDMSHRQFPRRLILALLPVILLAGALTVGLAGHAQRAGSSTSRPTAPLAGRVIASAPARSTTTKVTTPKATAVATPAVATPAVATPAVATPAVATAPAVGAAPVTASTTSEPSVATLVAEVEASGIEPGSNWTWTMGDSGAHCGVLTGAGTGCTYGSDGLEYSIFTGSPTLALVAHELANAETQNDAVPSLLNEVAVAAGGTSWSPTDAVASCLVEHFMGFQDNAAGTWQCPTALATVVADNIHDSY